jgi:hypothetical protein
MGLSGAAVPFADTTVPFTGPPTGPKCCLPTD